MKLWITLTAATAAAASLAVSSHASTHYGTKALSDSHLGSAPAELLAQQDHSKSTLLFFHNHGWMVARRHALCSQVPWARTCIVARRQVRLHRWLLREAENRYERIAFSPEVVKAWVLKYHPCLDRIIRLEDGSYEPTRSYGGYGNTSLAYGLPQAYPGTKMAWAGPDWRTNPYTQLKWMISYTTKKFGSECAAAYAREHSGNY